MFSSRRSMREFARTVLNTSPAARASVRGDAAHSGIHGVVELYPAMGGTLVVAELYGLPSSSPSGVFGFHIHEGEACRGDAEDPFSAAGGHFNPAGKPHPDHAGDMPPLFSSGGYAYLSFFTGRFTPAEVVGRTVIVHSGPDDFTTQPSGNSGKKIACGEIRRG